MTANFGSLLGILIILFFIRPFSTDMWTLFKSSLLMGAIGIVLKLVSFNTLNDWADSLNKHVGASAAAGALVFIGVNYAIQQADIPFIPNNVEMAGRYVLYIMGGILMMGSTDWGKYFTDVTGLLSGGGGGIVGIIGDLVHIVTLGLSNK